jgi:hypothetical protein
LTPLAEFIAGRDKRRSDPECRTSAILSALPTYQELSSLLIPCDVLQRSGRYASA